MANVVVRLTGYEGVSKQINSIASNLEKRADKVVENNVRDMVRNAKRDAPKDFGRLSGAITAKKIGVAHWEMVCDAAYAQYLEFGTKGNYRSIPGVDPSEFKSTGEGKTGKGFYDQILAWVKRKGIAGTFSVKTRRRTGNKLENQIADEQAAWAIYLSLIRHGVKAQPFFFKQGATQEPIFQADMKALLNEQRL